MWRSVAGMMPGPAPSTCMGSIYAFWAEENRVWLFEIEEGFSFEDLLGESGTLEEKALGMKLIRAI
jgi:hypothetical protein